MIQIKRDKVRVDGYDPITKTVYEFHGCEFHGCRKCKPNNRCNCNKRKKSLWPLINNSIKQNGVVQRAWIQTAWVETKTVKEQKLQVATNLN